MALAPLLKLVLPPSELRRFGALLQRGVALRVTAGRSVHALLTEELCLAPEYVEARISTVFMDGQVVDVLEDAIVREGSLLALSAAMPGLVGATLRKGGYYSAMRSAITRAADRASQATRAEAVVRVKLFNLLIDELGPVLLGHGIVLDRREAMEVLGGSSGVASGSSDGGSVVVLRVEFA